MATAYARTMPDASTGAATPAGPATPAAADREAVVELGVYAGGRRLPDPATLPDALAAARASGGFVWLGLLQPSHARLSEVAAELGLPDLAVEDAVTAHQRPKLEAYPDLTFMVLRPVRYVDSDEVVDVAEVAVFLGADFVVTARHGTSDVLTRVRRELDDPNTDLPDFGPSVVLYRAADLVVDQYESVVDDLEVDVDQIEDEVFGSEDDHSERIYKLKDEVASFQRAVAPLVRPMEQLVASQAPNVREDSAHHFRDVLDHVLRAAESVAVIDRQLTDALEVNTARVTVVQNRIALRQNEDMRKISSWAAIGLVPTAVAGVFGMNFRHMPGLDWWWGFPVTMAVTALGCLALFRAFRRNGWL
jgi:magnesium transporter